MVLVRDTIGSRATSQSGSGTTADLRQTIKVEAERAVLAAVRLPGSRHDPSDPFGELRALAEQAGARVVGEIEQSRTSPEAGTYIGRGKLEELRLLCEQTGATTIVFDHELSPSQISNIEQATGRKVLDRSELILDIFAARATTHEARLQVELAQLEYTYPRLRAMWDHLERIIGHGGIGGIGTRGPGEQQLETDRRLVQRRQDDLRRKLARIQERKRREVRERKLDHFTVALAGYTNAGKSTLFNSLTAGGAYADDRLFATLMSRTRRWDLGGGLGVMLSDTVGFVRDLPHNLVASFRATLEEVTHADLVLIVLDVSDAASLRHYETVQETLDSLLAEVEARERREGHEWRAPERVVLLNKIDRLPTNADLLVWRQRLPGSIPICAKAGPDGRLLAGHDELVARVREAAQGGVEDLLITVPLSDSRTIHMIESRGEVLGREYDGSEVTIRARIGRRQVDQLRSAGAAMKVDRAGGTCLWLTTPG